MDMEDIISQYHNLTRILIEKNLTISTMESCTGGLIGVLLSDREGASGVVKGGYFTYTNEQKIACGVPAEIIETYGVYSSETARAMATACRKATGSDIGIGITGSIGTIDPNNSDSIPGEVYFAINLNGELSDIKINLAPASRKESRLIIARTIADTLTDLLE